MREDNARIIVDRSIVFPWLWATILATVAVTLGSLSTEGAETATKTGIVDPKPLAQWTFEDGKADDVMEKLPAGWLEGNACVANGKLALDGNGYLLAAKDAKFRAPDAEEETPFDAGVQTLFYKPRSKRTGNMWDAWLYFHQGEYYLYYLAGASGKPWDFDNISMARSPDGVHWKEIGRVLSKGRDVTWMGTGSTWKSPNFQKDGKFFMNFSEWKGPRQTIFFAESKDLIHWTRLGNEYEFVQDERWYEKNGRWDCIWTIARPSGGLLGYWTANPKTDGEFGFGESLDGVHWQAIQPPNVVDAGIEGGRRHGEVGAVEKIGDKYYMLFGHYPIMVTLVADQPTGPFRRAKKNYKVLAGNTYFARFLPTPQGLLVNHHSMGPDWPNAFGQVYFAPLKRAVVDSEGTLRLGWWEGNENLKRETVEVKLPESGEAKSPVAMLGSDFDPQEGVILEGDLQLPTDADAPARGLYIECAGNQGSALLLRYGGVAELGPMRADGTGFKAENRIDREWKFGPTVRFRLLLKGGLIEFYLDDLLMQCYSLPQMATGKIGLIQGGQGGAIGDLKAWCCLAADASAAVGSPASQRPEIQAQLKLEYPQKHSIFQRTGNTGEILIEGILTGTPGPIQARFNNGPWTPISEGSQQGKFAATLTAAMGQGALEVRLKQSPETTASVPMVSIGDIFVVAGQSNAAGWASHAYEPLGGLPYEMSLYKRNVSTAWEKLRHPTSASGHGSPWPITMSYLCKDHRVPIGLITTAIGGAWLKQWQKTSGEHYPGMIETVRAATHGTMKVRAVLWFQGEADCNPSREYAHLSYSGDHDKYLAALKQFVSDVHRDIKLDTVYVGSIGSVPHKIGSAAISTRENIYHIRRALQDSWRDAQISPGPVMYDVALESDNIHIHFDTPEEMIPLAKRWAAAISSDTYETGGGRGPVLQKVELAADRRTAIFTFDKELKVSDYKGRAGTKAEGWSFDHDNTTWTDNNIASSTIEKNMVHLRFNAEVVGALRASYGVDNDGAGKKIIRGLTNLPVEPFYGVPVTTPIKDREHGR